MNNLERNTIIKKLSVLCALVFVCVFFVGCFTRAPQAHGTFAIYSITPVAHTRTVIGLDDHLGGEFELRLGSGGSATVSYIYFADIGNQIFEARSGTSVTTWSRSRRSNTITLAGTMGVGTIGLELSEGWILMTHRIDGEPIYVARFKKVVDNQD